MSGSQLLIEIFAIPSVVLIVSYFINRKFVPHQFAWYEWDKLLDRITSRCYPFFWQSIAIHLLLLPLSVLCNPNSLAGVLGHILGRGFNSPISRDPSANLLWAFQTILSLALFGAGVWLMTLWFAAMYQPDGRRSILGAARELIATRGRDLWVMLGLLLMLNIGVGLLGTVGMLIGLLGLFAPVIFVWERATPLEAFKRSIQLMLQVYSTAFGVRWLLLIIGLPVSFIVALPFIIGVEMAFSALTTVSGVMWFTIHLAPQLLTGPLMAWGTIELYRAVREREVLTRNYEI
jgi:hypothetical protein